MERWVETRKSGNFYEMAEALNISPITARILRNKDLTDLENIRTFLNPCGSALNDPFMLSGMERVVFLLKKEIEAGRKIRIIGDYDVDGISSTYILYKGLKYFGADVDYVIPHRIEDGYGININLIDNAHEAGRNTIVTCDNGISAYDQTEYAKSLGMTMIITDHHEVPFEEKEGVRKYKIPRADAVVDPKLPEDKYPFKGICGGYVAFQTILAYAISENVSESAKFKYLKEELTEFAALATVCDVMELKGENRTLVAGGMRLMEHSKNKGLRTLISVTGLDGKVLSPFHLGFVIGPCLNASGRLDTSLRALDLFLEDDDERCLFKAEELKKLNEERKEMTIEQTGQAFKTIDAHVGELDKVLVVFLPDCHESLAGIIAGRIREKYVRPTFVVTRTQNGLKGSGRSIDAYDMYAELAGVKEYLTKFGGHKLAAGISLSEDNIDSFRKALNDNCNLLGEDFCELVRIDMELPFEYADLKLARELEMLEPFGTGNDKPLFALRNVTIVSGTRFGKNKNVGKYKVVTETGRAYDMVYFGDLDALEAFVNETYGEAGLHTGERVNVKLDICYELSVNSFRGVDSAQLVLKHYR